MAVTANQTAKRQNGCRGSYLVAAATRIYEATLVFVTPAGYADDDTATGANKFGGVAVCEADNSSGAAGDKSVEVEREGIFELVGSGFTQSDAGKSCYATDNYTIVTAPTAAAVRIGRVAEYVSPTKLRVAIEVDNESSLLYAGLAASTAVSNLTAETAFDLAHTIKANTLRPGDVIRVLLQVIATATNSTDTLDVQLRLGTTDVLATGAVDVANNDIGFIQADIVIRTVGASGTFVAAGLTAIGVPNTVTAKPKYCASTALDTTADISVNASATWSVANAGNSVRLDVMNVQLLRKG